MSFNALIVTKVEDRKTHAAVKAISMDDLPPSEVSVAVGTAGFTAMLPVMALEDHWLMTEHGPR